MSVKDLTGVRFGRLVVTRRIEDHVYPSGKHRPKWECKCDCGKIIQTTGNNLKSGDSTSCGRAYRGWSIEEAFEGRKW